MLAEIPKEWESVICRCPRIEFHGNLRLPPKREFIKDIRLFLCTVCERPDRVHLFRCTRCVSTFLKDFAHPKWQHTNPNCFSCLDKDSSRATEIALRISGKSESERIPPKLRKLYLLVQNPDLMKGKRFTIG